MISRQKLYAAGETLGDCATQRKPGGMIYGGGGGGGGKQVSTTTPTLSPELKPLAELYTQQATNLANTPWQAYGGQRYASTNQTQNQGLDMVRDRAINGDPTMQQASQTLQTTLQGGQTNPYLDSLVGKAQQGVANNYNTMIKPQMETSMARSGSFGNAGLQQMQGQQQQAAADKMSDIATQMYGQAYNTDRANQMQALQLAPTYGDQAYKDAGQLMNAGNIQQGQQQRGLDFAFQQFQDQQNNPYKKLQTIGGVIGQNTGSTTTSTGGGGAK